MIRRPPRSTLFPYTTALPILRRGAQHLRAGARDRRSRGRRLGARGRVSGVEEVRRGPGIVRRRQAVRFVRRRGLFLEIDRKSTRLNSSHSSISYAVFCLKKKK